MHVPCEMIWQSEGGCHGGRSSEKSWTRSSSGLQRGSQQETVPYKTISALELVATVVLVILCRSRADSGTRLQGFVTVTAHSDTMVASQVLGRDLTTNFLLFLSTIAAAAQFEARKMNFGCYGLLGTWMTRPMSSRTSNLQEVRTFIDYDVHGLLRSVCGSEGKNKDQTWRRHALGRIYSIRGNHTVWDGQNEKTKVIPSGAGLRLADEDGTLQKISNITTYLDADGSTGTFSLSLSLWISFSLFLISMDMINLSVKFLYYHTLKLLFKLMICNLVGYLSIYLLTYLRSFSYIHLFTNLSTHFFADLLSYIIYLKFCCISIELSLLIS